MMLGETVSTTVGLPDRLPKDSTSVHSSHSIVTFLGMICGNDGSGGDGVEKGRREGDEGGWFKSAEFFTWKSLMQIWRGWSIERAFRLHQQSGGSRASLVLVGNQKCLAIGLISSYDGRIAMLRP
jgi:hypothetical protein